MQVTQTKQYVISNGRLEIMQILKKDEGKYICRAVNIAGQVETAAYLTIKGEIEILDVNLESHVFEQQVKTKCEVRDPRSFFNATYVVTRKA